MRDSDSRHFWPSSVLRTKLAEVPARDDRKARSIAARDRPRLRAAALLGLCAGLSACDGCGSQKPYTPFGVASGVPSAPSVPSGVEAPNGGQDSNGAAG